MEKKKVVEKIWKYRSAYLFVLPAILLVTVFKYYPFITSIYRSLFQWNGANIEIFNGIGNYIELFQDKKFWTSMLNAIIFSFARVAINIVVPFLAMELVANLKGRKQNFFKMGFIIPMVVPMMVITLLWKWILAGDYGIINMALRNIGLEEFITPWLSNSSTALGGLVAIGFPWISGLPFLIYLAGRQEIPEALYESASLEGTGVIRKIIHIDIPLLASQRKLIITYMFIFSFQIFEVPLVLTNGGPGMATLTPALYLYQKAFNDNAFGYSATIGVVLFLLLFIVTNINQRLIKDNGSRD